MGIDARLPLPDYFAGFQFQGTFYLNSTNPSRFAWVFQAPETGEIDLVEFYIGFVSGGNDIRVSLQDVNASGDPDGTDDAYKVAAKATGWQSFAPTSTGAGGGTRKSVTRGTFYAVVVQWDSTQSGGYEPNMLTTGGNSDMVGGTYMCSYNGSWTHAAASSGWPNFALKYADGNYYRIPNTYPCNGPPAAYTFNSGSTPDEAGLYLVPGADTTISGFWGRLALTNASDVVLYDSANTVLATLAIDPDVQSSNLVRYAEFLFASSVDLAAGDVYRLVLKPGGSNSSIYYVEVNASGLLQAWPGGGNWQYTSRTDGGAWSQTATRRPLLGLLVDNINGGGGGGGETSYPFVG